MRFAQVLPVKAKITGLATLKPLGILALAFVMTLSRSIPPASRKCVTALSEGLYIQTPLVRSLEVPMSIAPSMDVYFKMDNLQPSGSFKDRGIGHMINTLHRDPATGPVRKLISSSGGNAGHSVATTGQKLGVPVDVYVPVTTKPMMIDKLVARGANVVVQGENWNAADLVARRELARAGEGTHYIPPFDHPLLWEGHSSIVDELMSDVRLGRLPKVPDAIVVSVGGGGLLRGVQLGLERAGCAEPEWSNTQIIAVETEGAASFAAAIQATPVQPVRIGAITSVATSLGALCVTSAVLQPSPVLTQSVVVSDYDAVRACDDFLDKHRTLVEPACGAAIASLYAPHNTALFDNMACVVVVVCGGSVINQELLQSYKATVGM